MGLVLLNKNLVYISTYPSCYQPCHWCVKWIVPSWWVTSLLNMTPSRTRDSMYSSAPAVKDAQLHAVLVLLSGVWCCQGLIYQSPPRPCWSACPAIRCGKFKHHIHWPKFRWDLAVFFNLQSTLGKYSIKACDRWILPSIYFPLHYIHMNSTTNLFCTESHLFLLWREQMEGIRYHHSPDFSVTGLGPFKLPLILLM